MLSILFLGDALVIQLGALNTSRWLISSSINKCSKNNFYYPAWTSLRQCLYFTIHLFKEVVEGTIYHKLCCFIVSVHNSSILLFEIMFHVTCFIISNDWKLNKKSKLWCDSRQAGDFIFAHGWVTSMSLVGTPMALDHSILINLFIKVGLNIFLSYLPR